MHAYNSYDMYFTLRLVFFFAPSVRFKKKHFVCVGLGRKNSVFMAIFHAENEYFLLSLIRSRLRVSWRKKCKRHVCPCEHLWEMAITWATQPVVSHKERCVWEIYIIIKLCLRYANYCQMLMLAPATTVTRDTYWISVNLFIYLDMCRTSCFFLLLAVRLVCLPVSLWTFDDDILAKQITNRENYNIYLLWLAWLTDVLFDNNFVCTRNTS